MTGFIGSDFNGTEKIFIAGRQELPRSIDYRQYLTPVLDQGQESICVPCSLFTWIGWKLGMSENQGLHELYGSRTNKGGGMSFKEALYFLRHSGVSWSGGNIKIEEYSRILSLQDLKSALLVNGPCVSALPVYTLGVTEFWEGYGKPRYGYHAISLCGYRENDILVRNSWGLEYGDQGYTWCPFPKLLETWTIY